MSKDDKPENNNLQLNIKIQGENKEDIADKLRDIADTIDRDIHETEIPTKREH